ncbi:glycoside hydrolase family 3 N-terminal domain-containing protein [Streptomyces sp. NBC_01257]|uniref:glycoside hydrolase family 3 N-terminal domain-containing protein n=1 Tax=Streptomyces sp. NBC_01257 TaxID=2903799 RepID=UPI002DD8B45B|nr:glycoside hydrolase family 3 N-terminal domain-containing protein [Streptomyces sp. NBC_01257]WRZ66946.1 glycoside hydrolase family 3 C-terminal domain-containing protein [Streptomyces sp. NBC_01257]
MQRTYEDKVKALLDRMTAAEKFGQLQQLTWTGDTGPGGGQTALTEAAARAGLLGSVLNIHGAEHTNALQRMAVEESRLGIPLLFGLDVIHGFWTTFPIPLAQAASFDPAVAGSDAEVSAKETRSNGVHWTFSPMMDVTHEPRWGRIAESSGEDPYLNSVLAVARIHGYQGPADGSELASADRVAACAKHFVAYGGAEGGRDYNTVDVSEQRLRNLYLPPFKAALDAGVATVMAAFNTVSGVPAHGNAHTMDSILKQEWGFEGFVVSDYTGVEELIAHGFAEDGADAARLALNAGLDMEMVSTHLADHGEALLADGRVDESRLDDAVARILRLKFALGLFDHPYADESAAVTAPTAEARAAARTAGARSMVLLRNEDAVLPLSRETATIAVVGPLADSDDLHGTWAGPGGLRFPSVSVLDGVREAASGTVVVPAGPGVAEAVAAVESADVTVLVVGEPPALSGEAAVRSDIGLPAGQEELIAAVAATGKPFAVVLLNGRPLTIGGWLDSAPAVLEAWHPGIEAGHAVADVLFGAVGPGGKLPVSFPRSVGQIPVYYNRESTGRPYRAADPGEKYVSKYLDLEDGPLFPFGYGLSYTTFSTGEPAPDRDSVTVEELERGAAVEVAVEVTNTGTRTGDEVVQLYVHDVSASIAQPLRRLCGFERVTLEPGASATVTFRLGARDLGFWTNDPAGTFTVEPGRIDLYAGTSSAAGSRRTLTVR